MKLMMSKFRISIALFLLGPLTSLTQAQKSISALKLNIEFIENSNRISERFERK